MCFLPEDVDMLFNVIYDMLTVLQDDRLTWIYRDGSMIHDQVLSRKYVDYGSHDVTRVLLSKTVCPTIMHRVADLPEKATAYIKRSYKVRSEMCQMCCQQEGAGL